MSEMRDLLERALAGDIGRGQSVATTFASLNSGGVRRVSEALGFREPPPPKEEEKPADPELAAADALIAEVADRLDEADLEAIRADPELKKRFARRLANQRALNDEKRKQREAADAEAQAMAKNQERSRLASLGYKLGKAEGDQ